MNRVAIFMISLVLAGAAGADHAQTVGPMERVKQDVGGIVAVLKDATHDRQGKWERISEILRTRIDFEAMSQRILAVNWQTATDDERERFIDYFSQYLEGVYREKIEAYTNQRIEYVNEVLIDDRAVCDTVIVTSGTRIPVSYKLSLKDEDWFIYDVVIEGLSLVSNYRGTYAEKVRSDGMEGLLADLKSQIDQSRAEHLLQQ